jgi:hypothetical protein
MLEKDISFGDEKMLDRLEKSFKETNLRVNQTNLFLSEKFDDVAKIHQQIESRMNILAPMAEVNNVRTTY